jgi:hypothetical protein
VLAWLLLPAIVRTFGDVRKCEFDVRAFQLEFPRFLLFYDLFVHRLRFHLRLTRRSFAQEAIIICMMLFLDPRLHCLQRMRSLRALLRVLLQLVVGAATTLLVAWQTHSRGITVGCELLLPPIIILFDLFTFLLYFDFDQLVQEYLVMCERRVVV